MLKYLSLASFETVPGLASSTTTTFTIFNMYKGETLYPAAGGKGLMMMMILIIKKIFKKKYSSFILCFSLWSNA